MACIYILLSKASNKFYTGSSHDTAELRLKEHNAGRVRSTKSGRPWIVIHEERLINYTDARKRELFLKSGFGRRWVNEKFAHLKSGTS